MKCPVCQKDKTEMEFRPLINVDELKVGNSLSDQKSEREVGGAKLQMVCRNCWQHILQNKTPDEIIEMLETICGLLLEMDRRRATTPQLSPAFTSEDIEKMIPKINRFGRIGTPAIIPGGVPADIEIIPSYPAYPTIGDGAQPVWGGSNTADGTTFWQVGTHGARINWNQFKSLGDDFESSSALVRP